MIDTEKYKTMTVEEILEDTSLSGFHDFVRKVENTPASQLMPKKHERALTSISEMETRTLFKTHPNMPIKKVIITIFEPLTDDIPAPLMLKLTKRIINIWSELSEKAQQNRPATLAA